MWKKTFLCLSETPTHTQSHTLTHDYTIYLFHITSCFAIIGWEAPHGLKEPHKLTVTLSMLQVAYVCKCVFMCVCVQISVSLTSTSTIYPVGWQCQRFYEIV